MRQEGIVRLQSGLPKLNAQTYITTKLLFEELNKAVSTHASGSALDIGCGNKPYKDFFVNNCSSYIGCDIIQSSDNSVDVICKATSLDFEDSMFDTVFTTQVLEHVENHDKMLAEAFRVLKPHGVLILSAPFVWELHEEPYDFFRFTKYGLKELCDRHGFEILELMPNGGKWAAIFQMNINIIYSTFKKKNIFIKGLKFLFMNLHFTSLLNRIAIRMDKRFFDPLLTLNYVLVARKKKI